MAPKQHKPASKGKGSTSSRAKKQKLATLPRNAQVSKRPLLHAPIASRYSNADTPKVVYISAATPFLSAVKRVEKLLRLADHRLVQAATSIAKSQGPYAARGPGRRAGLTLGDAAVDEIGRIAATVEEVKDERRPEVVVVKGTGKAIAKVMEIGVWFQQRERYEVDLRTGTVSGIDDVEYEREAGGEGVGSDGDRMDTEDLGGRRGGSRVVKREEAEATAEGVVAVSETRIRKMSVLELHISLQ